MAQIAIIGTPGAGKTVFLSVLAMHYRIFQPGRPWLEYKNRETQRYVTDAWDTLQKQEWPASTPPGKFPALEWSLHTSNGEQHTLIVRDPAGQDVRAIYDAPPEDMTEEQREIKRIFDSADILLFLINLRPAIDAGGNQAKIDDIEIPLKLAIQDAVRNHRRVAVLVTQHDVIVDRLAQEGLALSSESREAISHFLPQIGGLLRAHTSSVGTLFVASVAETVPVVEDGRTFRRPKLNFGSQGLEKVVSWLEQQMPDVAAEEARRAQKALLAEQAKKAHAELERRKSEATLLKPALHKWIKLSVAAALVASLCFHLVRTTMFDQLHKNYHAAAVVEKDIAVEKERHVYVLPEYQYGIDFVTDLSIAPSGYGDYYRHVSFINKSGKTLYAVKVDFTWETSFWGTPKSTSMTIASVAANGEAREEHLIYCNAKELSNMRWQASGYYKEVVQEKQIVHDHTQDNNVQEKAAREALLMGLGGASTGFLPLIAFAICAIRVKNRMSSILATGA